MDANMTDEERLAEMKKWWGENGGSIITGVILGLALLFGGKAWFAYQENKAEAASNIYTVLMGALVRGNNEIVTENAGVLVSEYTGTPYASLAALSLARMKVEADELAAAHAQLQWVIDNSKSEVMRDIARLRLARVMIAMDNLDGAQALLAQIPPGSAFDALYTEVKGDVELARGDLSAANKAYRTALATTAGNAPGRHLLQLKVDNTAAAAGSVSGDS